MPPVERYKGQHLGVDIPRRAISEFGMVPFRFPHPQGFSVGSARPWADGNIFKSPLPDNLPWAYAEFAFDDPYFGGDDPGVPIYRINVIACENEKEAKAVFLQLRLRRIPDYARSGKFLIKATPRAFGWFVDNYGAERYSIKRPLTIW